MLYSDQDIKIAGDKPSKDIQQNISKKAEEKTLSKAQIKAAKELGKTIARRFSADAEKFSSADETEDFDMLLQRRLLLSFTATVGFEQYCGDDALSGMAQKSFLDTLKKENAELYGSSADTGAFSFYYLAYRRGSEIDRRMGQTFAMLCSHDGDPVYQELGEALYCWFISVVRKTAAELGLTD